MGKEAIKNSPLVVRARKLILDLIANKKQINHKEE